MVAKPGTTLVVVAVMVAALLAPKGARAFEQLMRGVIHRVFGVIERMNVQVDFDPFFSLTLAHARAHARFGN